MQFIRSNKALNKAEYLMMHQVSTYFLLYGIFNCQQQQQQQQQFSK
jgi:hypothetical protein